MFVIMQNDEAWKLLMQVFSYLIYSADARVWYERHAVGISPSKRLVLALKVVNYVKSSLTTPGHPE